MTGPADGPPSHAGAELGAWWHETTTAALLGTARRPVPVPPDLGVAVSGDDPRRLLDQLALGSTIRARPDVRRLAVPRSPDDEAGGQVRGAGDRGLTEAPEPATDLLRLLLHRPPVHDSLARELVVTWLRACEEDACRVPGDVLPAVLDLAVRDRGVRRALPPVLGGAGRLLCDLNPAWSPVVAQARVATTPEAWRDLPLPRRVNDLASVRAADPDRGLAWLTATFAEDPARVRAELVPCLAVGLSATDGPLLERCLDDRSASVRETARGLLDGVPGSARAARATGTLTPLVATARRLARPVLVVADPPEPDAAGHRDGLAEKAPRGVDPARWRVRRLVAAAPLSVLPGLTGWTPEQVVQRADDDVVAGLVAGVVAERAVPWAGPLLDRQWDDRLLGLVDGPARWSRVERRLTEVVRAGDVAALNGVADTFAQLPGRWPESLAGPVVAALAHPRTRPDVVRDVTGLLLERLPRAALRWLERVEGLKLAPGHTAALADVRRGLEIRGTIARTFA